MPSDQPQLDLYAQIAAQRQSYRDKTLVAPSPPELHRNPLPAAHEPAKTVWTPLKKLSSRRELNVLLKRRRAEYAPFLRNFAPRDVPGRNRMPITQADWRIETDEDRRDFSRALAGKGTWRRVKLPHYGEPLGKATTLYRMKADVGPGMMRAGAVYICFKAVDYKAHVFVNGAFPGSHEGFFAPFEFDCTPHLHTGENVVLVKVENDFTMQQGRGEKVYAATGLGYDDPEKGWHHCPAGMGIYQDVFLEARPEMFVDDIFVRPDRNLRRAEAWVEIRNTTREEKDYRVRLSVFGRNFRTTVFRNRSFPTIEPLRSGVHFLRLSFDMPRARLWSPDQPWLYQLQVSLCDGTGKLVDRQSRQFGMRSFVMDERSTPRGRMYLNGREVRLRGANTMGHLQQCVFHKRWRRLRDDLLLAKIANMNFLRLTQRPVQPEIYDYCDRLGVMTQTDLPLFGKLRPNQFCECVRQAHEMERLVRNHPCNVVVTYINEPFPWNWHHIKRTREATREQLESFFAAADRAVRLANPDRVIKAVDGDYDPPAPGYPDNHCYCGWYNGHMLDLGKLHKGFWMPIKKGWMYGCGEFGAEGLDPLSVMKKYYPPDWLPKTPDEECTWSPRRITGAQAGTHYRLWFDTQHTVKDWIRASRAHQAWAVGIQTEAFRRNSSMNSFAVHLFIDAFPAGWMKAIMDVDRGPKPAYFVYRDLLQPTIVSLRTDRHAFIEGETMSCEAWVCNDRPDKMRDCEIRYRVECDGATLHAGRTRARVPAGDSLCQGTIECTAPPVKRRTTAQVRLALLKHGTVVHETDIALEIFPRRACRPALWEDPPVAYIIGSPGGKASRLADRLGMRRVYSGTITPYQVILIDSFSMLQRKRTLVKAAVAKGARAILLELSPGTYRLAGTKIEVRECGMCPVHFVSRDTGHPLVEGFKPEDFKFWYDAADDRPKPLASAIIADTGDWNPILTSGDGGWLLPWGPAHAVVERPEGKGYRRICQVHLAGRIDGNPVAEIFARRLLTM